MFIIVRVILADIISFNLERKDKVICFKLIKMDILIKTTNLRIAFR